MSSETPQFVKKDDLARMLAANRAAPSIRAAREIIDVLFGSIGTSLTNGQSVHVKGFGRFSHVVTKERVGRNPKTGAATIVPARRKIRFKASAGLILSAEGVLE